MRRPRALLLALAAACLVLASGARGAQVDEGQVREIASELRCVVCQSLSVADSPSETANQMRQIIRERLQAGDTPEQVRTYFVEKYGLWILLSPPRQGFTLLVWVVPFAGLAVGLALIAVLLRRWSRRDATSGGEGVVTKQVAPAMRERISRELKELDR